MLTKVILSNFKSHEHTVVEFAPGSNALLGHNGAGKTSVLQAIGFALFNYGSAPKLLRKDSQKGSAEVYFISPVDGQEYGVHRTLASTGKVIMPDGSRRGDTLGEVYAHVAQLLGLEDTVDLPDLFSELVGVGQNQIAAGFSLKKAARETHFDGLLKIHEYKEAATKMNDQVRAAKQFITNIDLEISNLEGQLIGHEERTKQLKELDAQRIDLEKKLGEAEKAHKTATDNVATLKQKKESVAELVAKHREAENLHRDLVSKIQIFKRDLTECEEAVQWLKAHDAELKEYAKASNSLDRNNSRIQELTALQQQITVLAKNKDAAVQYASTKDTELEALVRNLPTEAPVDQTDVIKKFHKDIEGNDEVILKNKTSKGEAEVKLNALAAQRKRREELRIIIEGPTPTPIKDDHRKALKAAEAELASAERVKVSINDQFDSLRNKVCPLLDVTCPETDGAIDDALATKQAQLDEQIQSLKESIPVHREAAKAEEAEEERFKVHALAMKEAVELDKALAEVVSLEAALNMATSQITELDQIGAKMRLERQKAMDAQTLFNNYQTQLETVKLTTKQRDEAATARDAAVKAHDEAASKLAESQEFLDSVKIIQETVTRLAPIAIESTTRKRKADGLEDATKALQTHMTTVTAAERTMKDAEEKVKQAWTTEDEAALVKATDALGNATSVLATAKADLRAKTETLTTHKQRVDQDAKNRERLNAAGSEKMEWEATLEFINNSRTLIRGVGPYVREHYTARIGAVADDFFRRISGSLVKLEWNQEYDIIVTDGDAMEKSFLELSGGEQIMAAISLRLAMLSHLSPIEFAIFDEPTVNLDENARSNVAEVLEHSGHKQLIVVSHDNAFEETIHHAITLHKPDTTTILQG